MRCGMEDVSKLTRKELEKKYDLLQRRYASLGEALDVCKTCHDTCLKEISMLQKKTQRLQGLVEKQTAINASLLNGHNAELNQLALEIQGLRDKLKEVGALP